MNMKRFIIGAGLVVAAALPVYAHHSFAAEFDANKPVTLKGAVTKLEWANPHIWVYLDVKDDQGSLHALAVRGWRSQYVDAERLEQGFLEVRRPGHDRRRAGEGRLEDLQRPRRQASGWPERLCRFLGGRRYRRPSNRRARICEETFRREPADGAGGSDRVSGARRPASRNISRPPGRRRGRLPAKWTSAASGRSRTCRT